MNNENMGEREFSLFDLYMILKKHLILIFTLALAGAIVAGVLAWFVIGEQYKSEAQIIVQVETGDSSDEYDYSSSLRLINSVDTLMTSDPVLIDVNEKLDLGLDGSQLGTLRNNLNVTSSTTDLFISISYISPDPVLARDIVNQVIDSAVFITNGGSEIEFLRDVIVRISDAPLGVYNSPNKPLYVIIGGLLGGIIGVSIALISGFLDNTYKTKEEIQKDLDVQVLGSVPEFRVEEDF